MADRGVRRPPYQLTRAYAAWAVHRYGYLRGRLTLAGIDIDSLDAGQIVDVVEAALIEPMIASGTPIDTILDKLHTGIMEAVPDRETFGTTPGAREAVVMAEAMFGAGAAPRVGEPRPHT